MELFDNNFYGASKSSTTLYQEIIYINNYIKSVRILGINNKEVLGTYIEYFRVYRSLIAYKCIVRYFNLCL